MYKFLTYGESIGVAISYKASGVSTYITISFNASGKIRDIEISRRTARRPKGVDRRFILNKEGLLRHFETEKLSPKLTSYL
jgi:hypothetical protein